MKKTHVILILLALLLVSGCESDRQQRVLLSRADSLMSVSPSLALGYTDSLLTTGRGGDHWRAQLQLRRLNAKNKLDTVFTRRHVDEAKHLVEHFDRSGTPNERMLAHYLLGRTYADTHEAPMALEAYQDAVACADTTDTDCDYAILSRIYAQTARLFYYQYKFQNHNRELALAEKYALRAKDSLMAVECFSELANSYVLLNRPDSVLLIVDKAVKRFHGLNNYRRAAGIKSKAIIPLLNSGRYAKAKEFINDYIKNSGYVDNNGNVCPGREFFYYKLGQYYLHTKKLDSAEYYFRKELRLGNDVNDQIAGRKGLLLLYEIDGMVDSVAKYAKEGYELIDSSYSLSEMQQIQYLNSFYDYSRFRHESVIKSLQLSHTIIRAVICGLALIFIISALLIVLIILSKKRSLEKAVYLSHIEHLSQAQADLLLLHSNSNTSSVRLLEQKRKEIKQLREKLQDYQTISNEVKRLSLEERLCSAPIVCRLKEMANANPYQVASASEQNELRKLVNTEIPSFFDAVNSNSVVLSDFEYNVCMFIRVQIAPVQIAHLLKITEGYVSTVRTRMHKKILGKEGTAKEFDKWIMSIR